MQLQQEKQTAKSIWFANVGYSPTPRQHFWKIAGSKNFLVACDLGLETSLLGIPPESGSAESLRCLPVCCSPVLCCPNCLWIFLRLQFTGISYVSRMANSICLLLLDFKFIESIPLLRGQLVPLNNPSPPSWASLTAVACGSVLTINIKTRLTHTISVRMNRVLLFINRKFAANA